MKSKTLSMKSKTLSRLKERAMNKFPSTKMYRTVTYVIGYMLFKLDK